MGIFLPRASLAAVIPMGVAAGLAVAASASAISCTNNRSAPLLVAGSAGPSVSPGAQFGPQPNVPLCHSGLTPAQLPVPLSESEGLILTEPAGVRRLYETIARLLGSSVPSVDFAAYGQAFQSLERDYALHRREDGFIGDAKPRKRFVPNPRVLCVTSAQFKEIGFGNQLQIVIDAFPHNLKHDVVTSSAELTELLSKEHVDILHIAAYVCPRGGDIYFSKVDLPSGASTVPEAEIDKIHPDALATLLRLSQTILLVVGSCESLALATAMLTETDVIAPRDMVSAKAMATWVETFYSTLKTQPLAEAVSLATQMSRAPMKLYARQQSIPEVFFGKESDERAGADSDRRQATVAGP